MSKASAMNRRSGPSIDARLSLALTLPESDLRALLEADDPSRLPAAQHRFIAAPSPGAPLPPATTGPNVLWSRALIAGRHPYVRPFYGLTIRPDGTLWARILVRFVESASKASATSAHAVWMEDDLAILDAPLAAVADLAKREDIVTIELDEPLFPLLDRSVPEILQLGAGEDGPLGGDGDVAAPRLDGFGVAVGVIDVDPLDFHHPDFRDGDGRTRVACLLAATGAKSAVDAKLVHWISEEINRDLESIAPYSVIPIRPNARRRAGHGTHVAGIVVGNGRASCGRQTGVAPRATLLYANLKDEDDVMPKTALVQALHEVFGRAGDAPCVINLSVGMAWGPRDGSSELEVEIDKLVQRGPGRVVVVAAGNEGESDKYLRTTIPGGKSLGMELDVVTAISQPEWIELWCLSESFLVVSVRHPLGFETEACQIDASIREPAVTAWNAAVLLRNERRGAQQQILVGIRPSREGVLAPAGRWEIRLKNPGDRDADVYATIGGNTDIGWAHPTQQATSLTSPATAKSAIAVGNYVMKGGRTYISSSSSRGPTRDGRKKPDVAAPGSGIKSALSCPDPDKRERHYVPLSGTSMAAPHVAGLAARMLQGDRSMGVTCVRETLIQNAERLPGDPWDPAMGWGKARGR